MSYTFSIFPKHEMELHKQWKKRETSSKPLAPMEGRGIKDLHKCGEEMSKNVLPSPEPRTARTSELNGSGGERERDKRAKEFCPGWRHQPGQKGGLLSRLVAPTGTTGCAGLLSQLEPPTETKIVGLLIPFPLPPPEPFSSLVFLLFLARDSGVLAHFFTTFVKIFDSPSIHRR